MIVALRNSGLRYRVADPTDESIDKIDGGASGAGRDEQTYFRGRGWTGALDGRECLCIDMSNDAGERIGMLAYAVEAKPYPDKRSKVTAPFFFLYHLVLDRAFQGQDDVSGEEPVRWSRRVFQLIEHLARLEECFGVYLNVREDNRVAIRLYEGLTFVHDGSYVSKATGHMMRRYRLVFS